MAGAGLAGHHPVAPAPAVIAFVLACAAFAWRPGIWLWVVPAALPLLDFAPWTGWVVFEEFDLLLIAVVAGTHARLALAKWETRGTTPGATCAEQARPSPDMIVFVGLATVFGVFSVTALIIGIATGGAVSRGWFQAYADPLNSWRIFKSVLFAALLWLPLRQEIRAGAASAAHRLASGMLVGLAIVALAVVWERTAYTGLWDFSAPYRTTALFWEMHVGGAAIDAYLALATPFVAWALWTSRTPLRWAAAAALALLTGYACLTTFSRGVYLGVAVSLALLGLLLARQRADGDVRASALRALKISALLLGTATCLVLAFDAWGFAGAGVVLAAIALALVALRRPLALRHWRPAASLALALALALEVAAVLELGTYMRDRFAVLELDRGHRIEHWQNGLGLMHGAADWLLGIGLGRLPAAYARGVPGGGFPGDVQFVRSAADEGSGSVIVLGPKARPDTRGLLALTQRVTLHPAAHYQAAFDVRARTRADVLVQLCEMHLLYPRNCQAAFVRLAPGGAQWRHIGVPLRGPLLDPGRAWAPRLGVFSIAVVNTGGAAEFRKLSLIGPGRSDALANGDFSEGLARWFPSAQGNYVPWHIDNLYLELLIERGLLACVAFVLCMAFALRRLVGRAGRDVAIAPFLAASLSGALCVGLVSSVMDVPRVAFLLFLLTLFAVEVTAARRTALSGNSDARGLRSCDDRRAEHAGATPEPIRPA